MRNCSYCKVIAKISRAKDSRTQSIGTPLSLSSSFPPSFKGPGAGVTGIPAVRLSTITSAIFIPLLTAMPAATSTGGYLIEHGGLEYD